MSFSSSHLLLHAPLRASLHLSHLCSVSSSVSLTGPPPVLLALSGRAAAAAAIEAPDRRDKKEVRQSLGNFRGVSVWQR